MKNKWETLFLNVYGKPKPAKIWRAMKNQGLRTPGLPWIKDCSSTWGERLKPAKLRKSNKQ